MIKDKRIEANDGNSITQAETIIINQGPSRAEMRELAQDVYDANALKLAKEAAQIAEGRVNHINDTFINKLHEEHNEFVENLKDPAFQMSLFQAQKSYAKSGEKELEETLLGLLLDRVSYSTRNIRSLALDEAIIAIDKLTTKQIEFLALHFATARTRFHVTTLPELLNSIRRRVVPYVDAIDVSRSDVSHLEYTGCLSKLEASSYGEIVESFRNDYMAFFNKGFNEEEFKKELGLELRDYAHHIMPCIHDVSRFQFAYMTHHDLTILHEKADVDQQTSIKFANYFSKTAFSAEEVKSYILNEIPEMERVFNNWAALSKIELSTVGLALAYTKARTEGNQLNLENWIK